MEDIVIGDMERISKDTLEIVHKRVIEIGNVFHTILEKHSIPYYMLGGTMLGAIRHKGFIPWDDDMDFGIPRDYYDEALDVLLSELPSPYRLLRSISGEVFYDTSKIEDTSTEIVELGCEEQLPKGVFIDIFPLDHANGKWGLLSRNWWIKHIMGLGIYKIKAPQSFVGKILALLVKPFPHYFFICLSRKMLFHKGDFFANYGGFWGKKEIVSKVIFGKPKLYRFEEYQFYGVDDYEGYLEKLYGDYMKLPPEDKRHTHILSFKIKGLHNINDNKYYSSSI